MTAAIALVAALGTLIATTVYFARGIRDCGFWLVAWLWFLGWLGSAAIFVIVFLVGVVVANLSLAHHDTYRKVPLIALRDGTSTDGGYVLGTGDSGTTTSYVFYWRDGDAERLVTVKSDDIRLFEDSAQPYAVQFTGCELSNPSVAPCFNAAPEFTELHVPPGSVRSQFDLSLNGGGR